MLPKARKIIKNLATLAWFAPSQNHAQRTYNLLIKNVHLFNLLFWLPLNKLLLQMTALSQGNNGRRRQETKQS